MKNITKILSTALLFMVSFVASAEYSVIVHPSNENTIDKEFIEKIYTIRETRFESGHTINVLTLEDSSPVRAAFDEGILDKSPSQMNGLWSRLSFSGRGVPPTVVSSVSEMISQVAADEGAIGFVPTSELTGEVKVVLEF